MIINPNNKIPPITDPMGAYWDQPNPSNFLIDDDHALMTEADLKALLEYSTSTPSGVYEGKMWKRNAKWRDPENADWYLCWYGLSDKPGMVSNNIRKILTV